MPVLTEQGGAPDHHLILRTTCPLIIRSHVEVSQNVSDLPTPRVIVWTFRVSQQQPHAPRMLLKGLFVRECAEGSRCSRKTLCVCVWGKYLLLVRGVSRSKTLIPLILSQSGWIGFITKILNSPYTYRYRFKLFM